MKSHRLLILSLLFISASLLGSAPHSASFTDSWESTPELAAAEKECAAAKKEWQAAGIPLSGPIYEKVIKAAQNSDSIRLRLIEKQESKVREALAAAEKECAAAKKEWHAAGIPFSGPIYEKVIKAAQNSDSIRLRLIKEQESKVREAMAVQPVAFVPAKNCPTCQAALHTTAKIDEIDSGQAVLACAAATFAEK